MTERSFRDHQRKQKRERFVPPGPRRRTNFGTAAITVAGFVLLTAVVFVATRGSGVGPAGPTVAAAGTDVRLDVAQFADGRAHFFHYTTAANKDIRFFVVKSSDGVVRAAFDTCDVCYRKRKGYRQVGDTMVCNSCGQVFRSVDINVLQGGCNPVPLDRTVQGGQVVLTAAALEAGTFYF